MSGDEEVAGVSAGHERGSGVSAGRWWQGGAASAGALAILMLLIALVLGVAASNRRRDAAEANERHSYYVMLLVRGVDGAMARSEAALSRYIVNGDRATGTIYSDEWIKAGSQLDQLRGLVRDNPDQSELVAGLTQLYRARGGELAQAAALASYREGWSALKVFSRAGNSRTVPSIARAIRRIEANERALLDTRSATSETLTDRANALASLLSVAGLALLAAAVALGYATFGAIAQRRRARVLAEAEAERSQELADAVASRTRELSESNARLQDEMAEREVAEAHLRQIQKMEAVGQLTGGIAHDFNNMLAVVIGGLELARRRLADGGGAAAVAAALRQIDNAMEGANRAAVLTRRLLSFARAEPLLPRGLDPRELVTGMADLLDRTIGERIEIAIAAADGCWRVWVDGHQLENAILNLAVNARDAMDGHGRMGIHVGNRTLADGEIGAAAAGDYVCICVEDDGAGMSPAVLERAFEPFFTTKPAGKGTGLGLSQIFGFVRQSRGDIAIASTEGVGTAVSLYLPRHLEAARGESAAVIELVPAAMPAALRLLVVEDDPRVLAVTVSALEELGHDAMACAGGAEALAALAAGDGGFDLILSDVVMPGMTGPEMVARARKAGVATPVLLVTGYVGEAGDAADLAGHMLLRKPFTVAALERAIAASLAEADALSAPLPAPRAAAAG